MAANMLLHLTPRLTNLLKSMNKYTVCILVAAGFALNSAFGGQPDPRFEGVWVGMESYGIFNTATQQGQSTRPGPATIVIDPAGMQFGVIGGLGIGKYKLNPRSNGNKIWFEQGRSGTGRNKTTFVLSADGNTITETGFGLYPCVPYACECEIKATLHRKPRK
jgi:hypothetical protein